jgi:hypothetical protein
MPLKFIVLIWLVGAALISILIIGAIIANKRKNAWSFLKDLIVPMVTPVVVGLFGFWFASQQYQQQAADAERQQQTIVMRDIIASQEHRDISLLSAVDSQLMYHLVRYCRTNDQFRTFDEEAIFYFYGLHRAELVNLIATKGGLMFPRIWIEDVHYKLAVDVVFQILGANEFDPHISPMGEAVIYKYFGNASADDGKVLGKTPLLIDFHSFLTKTNDSTLTAEEAGILCGEFHNFQKRLQNNEIDRGKLIYDIIGMGHLAVYCYNNTFAYWYDLHPDKIPDELPNDAPEQFMSAFKDDLSVGTNVWNRIREIANPQPASKK